MLLPTHHCIVVTSFLRLHANYLFTMSSDAIPRVNAAMLPAHVGRVVSIIGRIVDVSGGRVLLDTSVCF